MMDERILIQADQAWEYFNDYKEEFATGMHEIAWNDRFGIHIYMTKNDEETLQIIVARDQEEIYNELCYNENDCFTTISNVYEDYLTGKKLGFELQEFEDEDEDDFDDGECYSSYNEPPFIDREDEIYDRELELDISVCTFIDDVSDEGTQFLSDEQLDEIKDHFLEFLARKYDLHVRRPMYLEAEDGEEFFTRYPYQQMIFDDPDNPLYKN